MRIKYVYLIPGLSKKIWWKKLDQLSLDKPPIGRRSHIFNWHMQFQYVSDAIKKLQLWQWGGLGANNNVERDYITYEIETDLVSIKCSCLAYFKTLRPKIKWWKDADVSRISQSMPFKLFYPSSSIYQFSFIWLIYFYHILFMINDFHCNTPIFG